MDDDRSLIFKKEKICLDNLWCCIRALAHFEEPGEAFIWMEEIDAPKVYSICRAILGSFYGDSIELESTLDPGDCLNSAKNIVRLINNNNE